MWSQAMVFLASFSEISLASEDTRGDEFNAALYEDVPGFFGKCDAAGRRQDLAYDLLNGSCCAFNGHGPHVREI